MATEVGPVQSVEAPPLRPLKIPNRLAPTPKQGPKYPAQVRNLAGQEVVLADPVMTRALVALMDTHAVIGGAACHWGGPAALAEIMSAIHGVMFAETKRPWHEAYNFVNDAGHTENGVYALRAQYGFDGMTFDDLKKIPLDRKQINRTRGKPSQSAGVFISNGPLGSGIPVAQGLALGDKLAQRDRVTFCVISDGACMEGEAKEAMAAIPGLAGRNEINPFILIVSDNDTKLSGRISADSFSMEPTFAGLAELGWNVRPVKEGQNLEKVYQAVEQALAEAKGDPRRPVCLWVKTIKGYGVKETEKSSSGGHGFPLKDGEKIVPFVEEITGGKTPADLKAWAESLRKDWEAKQAAKKAAPAGSASVKKEKVQAGFARAAVRAAQEGLPVVSISADLPGSTGVAAFQKAVPGRSFDIGVAEANMVSTCTGLPKQVFCRWRIPFRNSESRKGIYLLLWRHFRKGRLWEPLPTRVSRRGGWGLARSHDLLCRSERDSAHAGNCGELFGAGGGTDAGSVPATGERAGGGPGRGERPLFCGEGRFPRSAGRTARGLSLGQGDRAPPRQGCGPRGVRPDGATRAGGGGYFGPSGPAGGRDRQSICQSARLGNDCARGAGSRRAIGDGGGSSNRGRHGGDVGSCAGDSGCGLEDGGYWHEG